MGTSKESKSPSHSRMGEAPATLPGLPPLLIYTTWGQRLPHSLRVPSLLTALLNLSRFSTEVNQAHTLLHSTH